MAIDSRPERAALTEPVSDNLDASSDWGQRLARRLWLTDAVTLCVVVFGSQLLRFPVLGSVVTASPGTRAAASIDYTLVSVLLIVGWMWMLSLSDSRSTRVLGGGVQEYRAVATASFRLFGTIAIIALLARVDFARGYLLVTFPAGLLLLLAGRWAWRQWLVRQRAAGRCSRRVLLVGSPESVAQTEHELGRATHAGYRVVGTCVPDTVEADDTGAQLGIVARIITHAARDNADTIVVTSSDHLPPTIIKRLSWQLEAGRQHLVLAAGIADIAGPRIHMRPVAGLPLIHIETPQLSTGQLVVKRSADIVLSALALLILSPVLAVVAVLVKTGSSGRVIFRQTRIGHRGREFTMFKFRTMVDGAEDLLPGLADGVHDAGNDVLFKMRVDPRVTPVGRWLRRYSLDELPQLFNVLRGDMSMVGPRPPLAREVEHYDKHVHRRFLMKPGITGLWQVSGRSSLSWDETVRLDLSYVENYSPIGDAIILARTARAVILPRNEAW